MGDVFAAPVDESLVQPLLLLSELGNMLLVELRAHSRRKGAGVANEYCGSERIDKLRVGGANRKDLLKPSGEPLRVPEVESDTFEVAQELRLFVIEFYECVVSHP